MSDEEFVGENPLVAPEIRQSSTTMERETMSLIDFEDEIKEAKVEQLKKFLDAQPPIENGEAIIALWEKLYDDNMKSVIVETVIGESDDEENPVFPYEKLQAVIGDGSTSSLNKNWKWPRMWRRMDELERRGPAYRDGEDLNFNQPNKNEGIVPMRILIAGGGPVGMRMGIELALGGHSVTQVEKRREKKVGDEWETLGFTNRINRPHMWPFVRNDLGKLNGKDFLQQKVQYPVFTEPDTSSIGIDELQCLLLKNALLLGVDFRLGVGYKESSVKLDRETMKPTWNCTLSYDAQAAAYFGATEGDNVEEYDVLIGCDGPRSTVRDMNTKYLGNVEKRKFMDCIGIVANVQKVKRKRLRELGFEHGQEPNDMNRTKMIFKEYFKKLNEEADADLEGIIYYKASFHNYTILTPKRANLVKHGLSGKVYHHTVARAALDGDSRATEKQKLKEYCARILKVAGVPLDEELSNGGFVAAPNDVMAFDFAECWNTKKSMSFCLGDPNWSTSEMGPYPGRKPHPLVALAGDSLLEPFWPMGLGLKRGWHAIFDTCWAVDNIYNPDVTAKIAKKEEEGVSWDEHFEILTEQIDKNFTYCTRLDATEELGKGEYDEKGDVFLQLKKKDRDAEKPTFEVEIDPWTRYKTLNNERNTEWKYGVSAEERQQWVHPVVSRILERTKLYDRQSRGKKVDDFTYIGKKLVAVAGKKVAAIPVAAKASAGGGGAAKAPAKAFAKARAPGRKAKPVKKALPNIEDKVVHKPQIEEVRRKSTIKRLSIADGAILKSMGGAPATEKKSLPFPVKRGPGIGAFKLPQKEESHTHEMAYVPPPAESGHQEQADAMWKRMNGTAMSPAQQAELDHVQNMIAALTKSISAYKIAEKDLMMGKA